MKILLVEDSETLQRTLGAGLRNSGFAVDQALDGHAADAFLVNGGYDAVVLDLMIPGLDGLEVLARLRRRADPVYVLILSAKDRIEDRVRGLDLGADDYLVKPFAFEELVSRLRALARRDRPAGAPVDSRLEHGGLTLDITSGRADWRGEDLALTRHEFALLEALLRRRGQTFSHDQLIERVYESDREITRNALEAHVSTLRKKLRDAGTPPLIETRRGFGYSIRALPATPDG